MKEKEKIDRLVGVRLKGFRESLGLSQIELASMVGLTQSTISARETGCTSLRVDDLIKFSYSMQVSPADILPTKEEISSALRRKKGGRL